MTEEQFKVGNNVLPPGANLPADPTRMGASLLAEKKARVILATDHVAKDGYNEHQRYAYPTESAYMDAVRKPLAEAGLALSFTELECEMVEFGKTGSGKPNYLTTIRVELRLTCTESGWSESSIVKAYALDTEDKGKRKALASAVKDYLSKTFLLPAGDDQEQGSGREPPEARAGTVTRRRNGRSSQKKAKRPQMSDAQKELLGKVQKAGLERYGQQWPKERQELVEQLEEKRIEDLSAEKMQWLLDYLAPEDGEEASPGDLSEKLLNTKSGGNANDT